MTNKKRNNQSFQTKALHSFFITFPEANESLQRHILYVLIYPISSHVFHLHLQDPACVSTETFFLSITCLDRNVSVKWEEDTVYLTFTSTYLSDLSNIFQNQPESSDLNNYKFFFHIAFLEENKLI